MSARLDVAVDRWLGLDGPAPSAAPPGDELIGYHATSAAAIVRALEAAGVGRGDVFVDLGAGLGRVVVLAHVLTGARAIGVEIQGGLVAAARAAAARVGAGPGEVSFEHGDARVAPALDEGTVFFLYAPFVGAVLEGVLSRLRGIAARRRIVVCALGMDLEAGAPWLKRRSMDDGDFWLSVYDAGPGSSSEKQ